MNQGERIREVRNHFDLTLEKFGDRIGIKKNSVSQIENGKNSLTEQTLKSICREFSINEDWLRTGEGEMFVQRTEEEEIADLVYDLLDPKDNDFYIAVLELLHTYKDLTPSSQKIITEFASEFMKNCKKRKGD